MMHGSAVLIANYPQLAPVKAGRILNFAKNFYRCKSSPALISWNPSLSSPFQTLNYFKLFFVSF
jgi:hypothetical protein